MTPPAPITGSPTNAATRPSSSSSVRASAAGSSFGTSATSPTRMPYPSRTAGSPESDVPYAFVPWYAKLRDTTTVRSGRPTRTQYRRAIFAAVSTASPPLDPKNTAASSMGARSATRRASSSAGSFAWSPKT